MPILKLHSNVLLYSNTVIGTLYQCTNFILFDAPLDSKGLRHNLIEVKA